jgi:hypothetical protein
VLGRGRRPRGWRGCCELGVKNSSGGEWAAVRARGYGGFGKSAGAEVRRRRRERAETAAEGADWRLREESAAGTSSAPHTNEVFLPASVSEFAIHICYPYIQCSFSIQLVQIQTSRVQIFAQNLF